MSSRPRAAVGWYQSISHPEAQDDTQHEVDDWSTADIVGLRAAGLEPVRGRAAFAGAGAVAAVAAGDCRGGPGVRAAAAVGAGAALAGDAVPAGPAAAGGGRAGGGHAGVP